MNKNELKRNGNKQKSETKKKFELLTEEDLMYEEGKHEEMLGKFRVKLDKIKAKLHKTDNEN